MTEHDPTPMGTPIPAGECPYRDCGAFLWMHLRQRPVAAPAVAPPGQVTPCALCPICHRPVYLQIAARPAVALPSEGRATALVPKISERRLAPTQRLEPP